VRRPPLLLGALALVAVVGGVVAAGAFSLPATAVSVDGTTISRSALDAQLDTIAKDPVFACYLDASVAVRSGNLAALPSVSGSAAGTFDTHFVDFWLSQQVDNLLVERLADDEHLSIDGTALSAGRADLASSIDTVLGEAAVESGSQGGVCAPSGASVVATLPASMADGLVRAQAAGDLVLAHAAGLGLSRDDLERYFGAHPSRFETICLSAIQVASQSTAVTVRAAVEAGEAFATAAKTESTDTSSAPNGGVLGCFTANEGAYSTVAQDTSGLGVGQISQPIANNGSYLLLMPTSYLPAVFDAVVPAVRQAVLEAGSAKAAQQLSALTKRATVSVDPRYGGWSAKGGVGIEPPATPRPADLLDRTP
jgi:parvulin-like peptidyl-prolyl isomerase